MPSPPAPPRPRAARPLVRAALVVLAAACTQVPVDDRRDDARLFPARGVLRGSVVYTGPRPCSRLGHIVGNAVVSVFRAESAPPPAGVGRRATNFVAVPGDVLFAGEPRHIGDDLYCPPDAPPVTVSAPFTVAPLEAGSYVVTAFYERAGRFHPAFSFRNQPELGDVAGGVVDTSSSSSSPDGLSAAPLAPLAVGVPDGSGTLVVPPQGFLADNLVVTLDRRLALPRPYFHPPGADVLPEPLTSPTNPGGDARYVSVVTMTQDHAILAPPSRPTADTLAAFEASFARLDLAWGVAEPERSVATSLSGPFGFPLDDPPVGGLFVWQRGAPIPESPAVPALWPDVVLSRLVDDPRHVDDPQSVGVQGGGGAPVVLLSAIPLAGGSLAATANGAAPARPSEGVAALAALVRPAALCLDPSRPTDGTLVVPHLEAASADPAEGPRPLVDPSNPGALSPFAARVVEGCLPVGRYAISLVYPTGQTWTVPNESGSCAALEGSTVLGGDVGTCANRARPVLASQGPRGVLEIVPAFSPEGVALCEAAPTPGACLARRAP